VYLGFVMNNKPQAWKGDTPMRACEALSYEPAACWQRLQHANEFFLQDLDAQMKENHRQFLEALMGHERQCFLNAHPYERTDQRVDQTASIAAGSRPGWAYWSCACLVPVQAVFIRRSYPATNGVSRRSMKP
jgi:hypothetical protein